MKVSDSLPLDLHDIKGADIHTHGHLPIAAAYCRRLGLVELVNQMVPSQMDLRPGLVVQAMVLDTLSGRTPLYRIKDFMAGQDVELLLGTSVCASAFNDTNLARSLDDIFECQRVIEEAVSLNAWVDLGCLAQIPTKKNRPCASYKIYETSVTLHHKEYRAVVVHSSSHDKRRRKKLDKAIAQSAKSVTKQLDSLPTHFFCEADAKVAAKRVEALSGHLHKVTASISSQEVRKPGRPPADRPAPTNTRYVLSWELIPNTEAIEREKQIAGCFVLLTNVPPDGDTGMDAKKLLLTYKGQYGVENDFAFLKDPIIVNDIFLKKPHRIDALGMILVIALMVYRLMERTMRNRLKETKKELIGWENRKTDKPTTFMMITGMVGIMVALIAGKRMFLKPPNTRQTDYLFALALTADAFLNPLFKCQTLINQNLTSKG